jgi:dihydropyrimidinase
VVARIAAARRRGQPVTGETCPQYLFLTWDAYDAPGITGALPVCAPPLRPQKDQDALWEALARGDLQIVTTDHCPFVKADKARGSDDFSRIPGGVPSIEMRFVGLYAGVVDGRFSVSDWVAICCTQPAQLAGLKNKGAITIGYDADLVIFDPHKQTHLSTETLHENVDWTPYEGRVLQGAVEMTIRRGEIIVQDGVFLAQAGDGRFINRATS